MMQLFCKFSLGTRSFGTCSGYVGPYSSFQCKNFNQSMYCEGVMPKFSGGVAPTSSWPENFGITPSQYMDCEVGDCNKIKHRVG